MTDRIEAAVQELRQREAARQEHERRVERERLEDEARRDHARMQATRQREAAADAGRDAFEVTNDAIRRLNRAESLAMGFLKEHQAEHAVRRDVAENALDGILASWRASLDPAAERFVQRLCDPASRPSIEDTLRIVQLTDRARSVDETAMVLRGVLDAGSYSPLSTPEYEQVRRAAKVHLEAIRGELMTARGHSETVGAALQQLERGEDADAMTDAAAAMDCNQRAQAELHKMRAVLWPETTTVGTD